MIDSIYSPVVWIRGNGDRIAIEAMTDHEITYGREILQGDLNEADEALRSAIESEAIRRNM